MQAFCPKCDKEVKGSEEALLQQGTCAECHGGQLYLSRPYRHKKYSDIIAINFVPGSQLAIPLEPSFHITNLESFDEATDKISKHQSILEQPEITNVRPLEAPQRPEQTGVRNLEDIHAEHDAMQEDLAPDQNDDLHEEVTALVQPQKMSQEGTPVIHPKGNQREKPNAPSANTIEQTHTVKRTSVWSKQLRMGIVAAILGLAVGLFILKLAKTENTTPKSSQAQKPTVEQKKIEDVPKFLEKGIAAYESKDFPLAIKLFEQALADKTQASDAHRNLGITFARMNQYNKAVEHYRAYIQLSPNAPDAGNVKKILSDYDQTQTNR